MLLGHALEGWQASALQSKRRGQSSHEQLCGSKHLESKVKKVSDKLSEVVLYQPWNSGRNCMIANITPVVESWNCLKKYN